MPSYQIMSITADALLEAHGAALTNFRLLSSLNSATSPSEHSGLLPYRMPVISAFRLLIADFLSEVPDGAQFCEFGPGPCRTMYNTIEEKLRENWLMLELNHKAISGYNNENSEQNSRDEHQIVQADYHSMPFADNSVKYIGGLSSWDSTPMLDLAVSEAYRCLEKNGGFMHIQDIKPSQDCIAWIEALERQRRGLEPVCTALFEEFYRGSSLAEVKSVLCNDDFVPAAQALAEHLAESCRRAGFGHVSAEIITRSVVGPRTIAHDKYPGDNIFTFSNGDLKHISWRGSKRKVIEEVTAYTVKAVK